jgi:hypothetical protein
LFIPIESLETNQWSIKNQSTPVTLTVAMDEDLPEDKQQMIYKYADKVKVFPRASYYAKGGIWKKIWTCWKESKADYVAWQGYDDISHSQRFAFQVEAIERTQANSCFGIQRYFTDSIDNSKMETDGNINFLNYLGGHVSFMGGFLHRKNAILSSGLGKYQNKWVHYFEGLLYLFTLKSGLPCNSDGTFFFRFHKGSIAETKNHSWVTEQRDITNYTYEECILDWETIKFDKLCKTVKKQYGLD